MCPNIELIVIYHRILLGRHHPINLPAGDCSTCVCVTKCDFIIFLDVFNVILLFMRILHANLVATFLKVRTGAAVRVCVCVVCATVAGSAFYFIICFIFYFLARIFLCTHSLENET